MSTEARKKQGRGAQNRDECSQGRVLGLQLLYAFEQKHYEDDDALLISDDDRSDAAVHKRAQELYGGFCRERAAIDACIDRRLQNWTLERLAVMDRAVLRLGCYELLYCSDVPASVVINEYIELAKQFGSDGRTAKLVNGVLDKIAREHRPDEVKPKK